MQLPIFAFFIFVIGGFQFVGAQNVEFKNSTTDNEREHRLFSFLQVVKFPNDICEGSSRNGTCYTSSECTTKGGVASGSCANGFGVCCIFSLLCGGMSSENCTYLTLGATNTPSPLNCMYTICKNNPNICRIRLDFTTFVIASPAAGQTSAAGSVVNGGSIGACVTDAFSVTSPGNRATPEICGFNTGQHMFVDASDKCSLVDFRFGQSSTVTRQYDIKVTQYSCQDEMGGPPDCLQYFTADKGTVSSFNFQADNNVVTSTVTHLQNQLYSMCFRRNAGNCAICFMVAIAGAGTAINQASFGVSISGTNTAGTAVSESDRNGLCSTDYLIIPNSAALGSFGNGAFNIGNLGSRYCGRFINPVPNTAANAQVCTITRPFKIVFRTDNTEVANAGGTALVNEQSLAPGGIIGFSLDFMQIQC